MHDLVTKLASLSRMLGSVYYAIGPYPSNTITGGTIKAEKVPDIFKPKFQKMAPVNIKTKYISGIT